ncbi:hypothetical protein PPACK8108_LOCUS1160 [Phakopsora pachyrhizi]|uniref:Mediator of RNA polymerase II transcription subunit 8 n=1 Tax=Phakopsora pachyrhizi TaxID=170000 RepID=A0AAV0AFC5_PHAPC|nr:hypothetical protein PPACK8108_LOCUS1160 [Phakopsora pachyrhizi]
MASQSISNTNVSNPTCDPNLPINNQNQNGTSTDLSLAHSCLSESELDRLRQLPVESLDTIRSKLVQLIDAIATFRYQLESLPLTPQSLPYSALISKFLILLNHTEALSQALNTAVPLRSVNRFDLPSVRAEREQRSRWEDGASKRSTLGNLVIAPRGLDGLEDGKEWIVGVLTRTKLAPEIEGEEQRLLSMIPAPDRAPGEESSSDSVATVLKHVRKLTEGHEKHVNNCRRALHRARYNRPDQMEIDNNSGDEVGSEGDEKYEWKMRVEVKDQSINTLTRNPTEIGTDDVPPSCNPTIKGLLGFMKDGRNPTDQTVRGT